jgi:hypothetical protein
VEADRAVCFDFDAAGRCRSRRRTTDVEGAHRELRARLADRLRGDDADRFADVDQAAAGQVAAVAAARRRRSVVAQVSGERTLT